MRRGEEALSREGEKPAHASPEGSEREAPQTLASPQLRPSRRALQ